ncbi:MAG: SHOCT domain-containing protein [Thaumarchaeota archaeon]|nr:SHOCT domain-containing protein [Nitrososphaerota archaeon]
MQLSEILRERLDRGEITKEQYSEMKRILDKT